jgi:hypothetical protein
MARGIISTILGGVAGGLEGRRVASIREREEMERERDRQEREQARLAAAEQQRLMNALAVRQMGGRLGGAPRIAQETPAQPAAPARSPLDSALFEGAQATRPADMGESVIERPDFGEFGRPKTPIDSALAAGSMAGRGEEIVERPEFGQFARPRTEFVVDPDYEEITIGDQTFSFLTAEAEERKADEVAQRDEAAAAALRQEQRDHDISMKVFEEEFRRSRDSLLHGYNVAIENLRHSNALNRIIGTEDDRISEADIQKALMQLRIQGKRVIDPYTGQPVSVDWEPGEILNIYRSIQDELGLTVGYGEGRGKITGEDDFNMTGAYSALRNRGRTGGGR